MNIIKFDKIVCKWYVKGKSIVYLSKKLKMSTATIWKTLKRNNIKTRSHAIRGEKNPKRIFNDKEELNICQQYKNGFTMKELSNKYNTNDGLISKILKRNNYVSRTTKETGKVGKYCSRWKGGISYDEKGYKRLYLPDDKLSNNGGLVKEHRYIMQKHLGRRLKKNEDVHHINGNKNDNRIENLRVIDHKEHGKLHNIKLTLLTGKARVL